MNPTTSRTRIKPGRFIVIPPWMFRKLGGDPARLVVAVTGRRLVVTQAPTPAEVRVARLKKRLVAALASVKPSPEVEARFSDLASKSRQARQASFLQKYRISE